MTAAERVQLVRKDLSLSYATLAYNSLEGLIAIAAGITAGSIALVGFGVDSVIEVGASVAAIWRLKADVDPEQQERAERLTLRIVGSLFLALAVYVTYDAADALLGREAPDESPIGIALAAASW